MAIKETDGCSETRYWLSSGHTAQAFAAATFLHQQYGKSIRCGVLAYCSATAVGVLRVMNKQALGIRCASECQPLEILATNLPISLSIH